MESAALIEYGVFEYVGGGEAVTVVVMVVIRSSWRSLLGENIFSAAVPDQEASDASLLWGSSLPFVHLEGVNQQYSHLFLKREAN